MELSLEGFEACKDKKRGMRPMVSVRKSGQIGLNQGAVEKYNLSSYTSAYLYYNREENKIAIQLLQEDAVEEGAFLLRIAGKKTKNATISARTFMDNFGIEYGEQEGTPRYDVEYYKNSDGSEFLVFDLNKQRNQIRKKKGE